MVSYKVNDYDKCRCSSACSVFVEVSVLPHLNLPLQQMENGKRDYAEQQKAHRLPTIPLSVLKPYLCPFPKHTAHLRVSNDFRILATRLGNRGLNAPSAQICISRAKDTIPKLDALFQ